MQKDEGHEWSGFGEREHSERTRQLAYISAAATGRAALLICNGALSDDDGMGPIFSVAGVHL